MFTASDAAKLSDKWNWKDRIQMCIIKRKIRQHAKNGEKDLILWSPPNSKIVSRLRNEGYETKMVYGSVFMIKWKKRVDN